VELPRIAPASFIHPCRPIDAAQPPSGPGGTQRIYTIGLNAIRWSPQQPARSMAAQSSTQKSSGLGQTVRPIPTPCIAAQTSQETLLIGSPFFVRAQL